MKKLIITLASCFVFFFMNGTQSQLYAQKIMSTEVIGQGQPMILIHGMSCSADVWTEVVNRYKSEYEIHLVTLKGFGNKEEVEVDHYLQTVRDELIAYTKEKKLKNTILMGHSMGGFLSLWAAAEAPDLFAKVISVDGIPYFPVLQMPGITAESAKEMVKNMQAGMANLDEETYKQSQNMIIASMIATESKRAPVVEMGINCNRAMVNQAYGEMFTTDIRPEMSKIKVPVLTLGAWAGYKLYGATKASTIKNYESQLKDIPNSTLKVADEAFHFIFYDEPEWFFEQVDTFIKETN